VIDPSTHDAANATQYVPDNFTIYRDSVIQLPLDQCNSAHLSTFSPATLEAQRAFEALVNGGVCPCLTHSYLQQKTNAMNKRNALKCV
jgi:hypothetical protein